MGWHRPHGHCVNWHRAAAGLVVRWRPVAPNLVSAAERFVGRADELRRIDRMCTAAPEGAGRWRWCPARPGSGRPGSATDRRTGPPRRADGGFGPCWGEGAPPPLWPWQPILADLCGTGASRLLGPGTTAATVEAADADRFAGSRASSPHWARRRHGPRMHRRRRHPRRRRRHPAAHALRRPRHPPAAARPGRQPAQRRAVWRRPRTPMLAEIEREAIPVVLHHFDLDEATTFLADQGLRQLAPDLVLALLKVTGGNPLFLRRIAALGHLIHTGHCRRDCGWPSTRRWPHCRPTPSGSCGPARSRADTGGVRGRGRVGGRSRAVLGGRRGDGAGLVTSSTGEAPDRFAFTHEMVRSALEDAWSRAIASTPMPVPPASWPGRMRNDDGRRGCPGRSPGPAGASRIGLCVAVDGRRPDGRRRLSGRRRVHDEQLRLRAGRRAAVGRRRAPPPREPRATAGRAPRHLGAGGAAVRTPGRGASGSTAPRRLPRRRRPPIVRRGRPGSRGPLARRAPCASGPCPRPGVATRRSRGSARQPRGIALPAHRPAGCRGRVRRRAHRARARCAGRRPPQRRPGGRWPRRSRSATMPC